LLLRLDLNKKIVWELLKFSLDMADNYSILVVKEKDMNIIMTKTYNCNHCDHTEEITFGFEDYADWKDGGLIQNTLDYLTPDEREMMISGTCGKCFDKFFPPND